MPKGASKEAQSVYGTGQNLQNTYTGEAQGIQGELSPFLQNELNNPQGYGAQTLSQMQTAGGQAVSGATGAAGEQARLQASRTGNPAATAGVIDATARNAMAQQSNNALNIDQQNALLKQKQQQAGASGLENLYGQDIGASLKALGLADEGINSQVEADKASPWNSLLNAAGHAAGAAAAGAVGA